MKDDITDTQYCILQEKPQCLVKFRIIGNFYAAITSMMTSKFLGLVTETTRLLMKAEWSWLHIWDNMQKRLILQSAVGFPSDTFGSISNEHEVGLTDWVYKCNEIVNIPDFAMKNRWSQELEYETLLSSGHATNTLIVPLTTRGKRIGALGVTNKKYGVGFDSSDEFQLLCLARQIATEITRKRLCEVHRNQFVSAISFLMSTIKIYDSYTHAHLKKVPHLAAELGKHVGLCSTDINYLRIAALLHDIGKIAVPIQILSKNEKLTLSDWEIVRQHPYHGVQLIQPISEFSKIAPWIYYHHEKWDGTGYPIGLRNEEIPLEARILSLVDSYTAMIMDRPYRKALSNNDAIVEILQCAGTQFDPDLAKKFTKILINRH